MSSPFSSAVEEFQHLPEAPPLGAVVAGTEGVTLGVVESVVRGTTRQVDELEDFTLRPEPLKDVRVVCAGSTFRGHLDFFHGYILPHSEAITSLRVDLSAPFATPNLLCPKDLGPFSGRRPLSFWQVNESPRPTLLHHTSDHRSTRSLFPSECHRSTH